MRICFYDWALHSGGGGQKFDCKIAEHLSKTHEVDILTLFPIDIKKIERDYSVDLSKVNKFIPLYSNYSGNPSILHIFSFRKISAIAKNYDLFFNADAHETVKPSAKYNLMYCHFFEPKVYKEIRSLSDFFKVSFVYLFKTFFRSYAGEYDKVYCNSNYTKFWLKKLWKIDAEVIYPPVDLPKKENYRKKKIILSTGRLTPDKNYEFVIDCFKQLYNSESKARDYRCIICGIKSDDDYLSKLKKMAEGYPIEIKTDLSDKELKAMYSQSSIFLQAKGWKIDENKHPGLLEHFGMAVAESMSYGCVPLALNKAGYKETIDNGSSGFLFESMEEAVEKLKQLIKNPEKMKKMGKNAVEKARRFSVKRMRREIDKAIECAN